MGVLSNHSGKVIMLLLGVVVALLLGILNAAVVEANSGKPVIEQAYNLVPADGSGLVPDDMCYTKDGAPIIYAANLDAHGDYAFSYLTTGGNVVSLLYNQWIGDHDYHILRAVSVRGAKCPTS